MKLTTALLICCASLISLASTELLAASKNVVLLFDERVELPGLSLIDSEFVRKVRSQSTEPVEIYRESMDLSRFSSESYKKSLRDFLRTKYADKQIDVVVAVMAPAFDFLLESGPDVFPGSRIVFCGLDGFQVADRVFSGDVHGVLLKRRFAPTLEVALRLHSATEQVIVVAGATEFDRSLAEAARNDFKPMAGRVAISYWIGAPHDQLLSDLSKLPPRTIVLFVSFFRDGTGQSFVPHLVLEEISKASSAPVYGFVDQFLGRGIVGGSLYSVSFLGEEAANLTVKILRGEAISQPTFEQVSKSELLFDWRQMQRWAIDEKDLPFGSKISFREQNYWKNYRWQLGVIAFVVLFQAWMIAVLLYEHRQRRLAEVEARQHMAELVHINRVSMAGELATSIAHELNQPLGAILTNTETAELILKSSTPDLHEIGDILVDIRRDNERASEVIRRLRSLLKKAPFEAREISLNEAVSEVLVLMSSVAQSRDVNINVSTSAPLMVRGDRIQLQQVFLNLIVNALDALSHLQEGGRRIDVETRAVDGCAEVSVSDTGPGIPAGNVRDVFEPFFTTKNGGMGMGLSIARTIIEAHNGKIYADNQPQGGAVFRIRLPLALT